MYKHHFDKIYGDNVPINYERYFVPVIGKPLALDLVEQADLQIHENILDVACGTVIVARLASKRVGTESMVKGLDANPGMLAVVRSFSESIERLEANAEAIPLPDNSFNVIFCQMGLQFMEDKAAALQEMLRVLTPGGRLFLNIPGPAVGPFVSMADAMKKHISIRAAGFVSHVFSPYGPEEIKELAIQVEFHDIMVNTNDKELHLPKAEEFLWQYIFSTPLAAVISKADDTSHAALEKDVFKRWQNFSDNGSVIYAQPIVTMVAKK